MFIVPITRMPGVESLESIAENGRIEENSKSEGKSFQNILGNAISEMEENEKLQSVADENLATGGVEDLHTAMIQAEQTAAAVEFTTQLTSKAVSAYNQIMGMQV